MPGMIKKEDIEKVRATADLYDIVSATVTLKPSGTGTYVGLCPFHDEKTPSFSVRPALGVWHCFGCGLGGEAGTGGGGAGVGRGGGAAAGRSGAVAPSTRTRR